MLLLSYSYNSSMEPQTTKPLLLLNSPRYSINLKDCMNIVIRDVDIFIDSSITRIFNHESTSVMYPLNTDGIDIAATNVTVYNVNITNYDDAIVVKPCHRSYELCKCSGDMIAYDNTITFR